MCAATRPQSPLDLFCAMVLLLLSTVFGRSPGWAVCDSHALNEPSPPCALAGCFTLTLDCRPCSSANSFLMVPGVPISW